MERKTSKGLSLKVVWEQSLGSIWLTAYLDGKQVARSAGYGPACDGARKLGGVAQLGCICLLPADVAAIDAERVVALAAFRASPTGLRAECGSLFNEDRAPSLLFQIVSQPDAGP